MICDFNVAIGGYPVGRSGTVDPYLAYLIHTGLIPEVSTLLFELLNARRHDRVYVRRFGVDGDGRPAAFPFRVGDSF